MRSQTRLFFHLIDFINSTCIVCHFGVARGVNSSNNSVCQAAREVLQADCSELLCGSRVNVSIGIEYGDLIVGNVGNTLRSFVQLGRPYQVAEMCAAVAHTLRCGIVVGAHTYFHLRVLKYWRVRLVDMVSNAYLHGNAERMYQVVGQQMRPDGEMWMYEIRNMQMSIESTTNWDHAMNLLFSGKHKEAAEQLANLPEERLRDWYIALASQMSDCSAGSYMFDDLCPPMPNQWTLEDNAKF
eukprot:NODE_602_length_1568_cov_64.377222_g496_i0.p1 GENE.NODE_602_length_1568_cov_64.377222_g496_i0~~NODE_602_length_1568_cov_64.377222_g496_i0.p1  ORF type:complete len:241 (+),score=46.59 NODE_602_length_1568_cov_64.377222_g496_i0:796-1518(+)